MSSINIKMLMAIFAFILTALPAIFVHYYDFPTIYAKIFYSSELILIFILIFIYYHKYLMVYILTLLLSLAIFSIEGSYSWSNISIPITFWVIYSGCWLIYFEVGRSSFGQKIKMLHPVVHFSYYLLFMITSVIISFFVTFNIYDSWRLLEVIPFKIYLIVILMSFFIPTITISLLKIIDMIGGKHVFHFFFGTYKRPVETVRIVLFLDMVGSSKMAEKLSPKKSMELISRFIFDASYIFRTYRGDIVNYTGDGLVVVWRIENAKLAINSTVALRKRINKYREIYKKNYEYIPDFRIGIHAGRIVVSQLGEEKLFLGIYGDVVNTSARLEQLNKNLNTKILVSGYFKRLLGGRNGKKLQSLGVQSINGKKEKIEVFTYRGPEII